jgi:hypothetical protein
LLDITPDVGQISQLMSQATAPAFVLGAVAAFVSVLLNRMTSVIERIRSLHEIADNDTVRARQRASYRTARYIWPCLVGYAQRCSSSWDLRARSSGCDMNLELAFFLR